MNGDFRLFQQDSKVSRFMGTAWQLICLQFLALLCCLPLVTAGASVTAMHYVLLRLVRKEESYLSKDFFHSFRDNLKASTLLWLIKLAFLVPMAGIFFLRQGNPEALPTPVAYTAFIFGFLALMLLSFVFPLQSHFVNSISGTLGNSMRLSVTRFPRAFVMTFIWIVPVWILLHSLVLFPLVLLLGLSLPGYVCARLYHPVFRALEKSQEESAIS